MSRGAVLVDLVVLAWIERKSPDPATALAAVERCFTAMSGRLGYFQSGLGLTNAVGTTDDGLDSLMISELGTLSGMVTDNDCQPNLHWDQGTLSIWRRQAGLPESVTGLLEGRRLGEVATHPLLPPDALIVAVDETGSWLRLTCSEWTVGIEEARARLAGTRIEGKKQ